MPEHDFDSIMSQRAGNGTYEIGVMSCGLGLTLGILPLQVAAVFNLERSAEEGLIRGALVLQLVQESSSVFGASIVFAKKF